MSTLVHYRREFPTQDEAEAEADSFRQRLWAYDGMARVYAKRNEAGETIWVVDGSYRDSCD